MRNQCGHVSGYSGATFCSESCAMADHDDAHPYPEEWAAECSLCLEQVELTLDDLPEDVRQDPQRLNPALGENLDQTGEIV